MIKTRLLLGAAIAAFGIIPVAAQADQVTVSMSASWDNTVDVDLAWSVDVTKNLNIDGSIEISGEVDANALSQASLDDKQIVDGNSVQFEDYQNANQNQEFGPCAEPGVGQGEGDPLFTEEGAAGGPAVYANTVTAGDGTLSNASGNIGLNMAAGDYNLQENAAVISSAESNDGSGAAEAGSFSLQNLYDNGFNDVSFELENTDIDNTVAIGAGLGDGARQHRRECRCWRVQHPEERSRDRDGHGWQPRGSHCRNVAGSRRELQRPRRHDEQRQHRQLAGRRVGQHRRQPRVWRWQHAAQHAHDCQCSGRRRHRPG